MHATYHWIATEMHFQWYLACLIWSRIEYTQPPQSWQPLVVACFNRALKIINGALNEVEKISHQPL
jgi:hypothetical protein